MSGFFLPIWCIQLLTSLWLCGYWIHWKVSFERNNIILCSKNPPSPSQTMAITGIDYSTCAGHAQPPRNHLPFYRSEKWGLGGVTCQWVHVQQVGQWDRDPHLSDSGGTFCRFSGPPCCRFSCSEATENGRESCCFGSLFPSLREICQHYTFPWLSGNPSIIAITVFYC